MFFIKNIDIMNEKQFIKDALAYGLFVRRFSNEGPNGYAIYDVAHHDKLYLEVAMADIYFDGDLEIASEMIEEE